MWVRSPVHKLIQKIRKKAEQKQKKIVIECRINWCQRNKLTLSHVAGKKIEKQELKWIDILLALWIAVINITFLEEAKLGCIRKLLCFENFSWNKNDNLMIREKM